MSYHLILLFSVAICATANGQANQAFLTEWKAKWKNATTYTLKVAELMPEENYRYEPTEAQMTYEEQLLHAARQMVWIAGDYLQGGTFVDDLEKTGRSKEELLTVLENSLNYTLRTIEKMQPADLEEKVDFFAGEMTKRQMLSLLQDHLTHHRGQMVVYLRLKNIKPPRYIGW